MDDFINSELMKMGGPKKADPGAGLGADPGMPPPGQGLAQPPRTEASKPPSSKPAFAMKKGGFKPTGSGQQTPSHQASMEEAKGEPAAESKLPRNLKPAVKIMKGPNMGVRDGSAKRSNGGSRLEGADGD